MSGRSLALLDQTGRSWPRRAGIALLVIASPLLLMGVYTVVVLFPLETAHGVADAFSGRDIVQTQGSMETGVTLTLLLAATWGALRLFGIDLLRWFSLSVVLYGALLAVPIIAALGYAATYGLDRVLDGRGYRYCTLHVLSRDRGESGLSVYIRRDRPGGCDQVRAMFPAHTVVEGNTRAFDLPPR